MLRESKAVNREQGFTIIELIIVLVITAILATLAVVTYSHLAKKAKRVQAQTALKHLAKTEYIYFSEYDRYTDDIKLLDYEISNYEYYTITITASETNFTGKAVGNLDSDPDLDIWMVDKSGEPFSIFLD
jgi:type IV pilus assembly protein PilE